MLGFLLTVADAADPRRVLHGLRRPRLRYFRLALQPPDTDGDARSLNFDRGDEDAS